MVNEPNKTDIKKKWVRKLKRTGSRIKYKYPNIEILTVFLIVNSYGNKLPDEYLVENRLSEPDIYADLDERLNFVFEKIVSIVNLLELLSQSSGIRLSVIEQEPHYTVWKEVKRNSDSLIKLLSKQKSRNNKHSKEKQSEDNSELKRQFIIDYRAFCIEYEKILADKLLTYIQYKKILKHLALSGRNFNGRSEVKNDLFQHTLVKYFIDENGMIQRTEDPFIQALIGTDVRRIKECKICRDFFWANRLDKTCCTKICADVYNQRNLRQRKREIG